MDVNIMFCTNPLKFRTPNTLIDRYDHASPTPLLFIDYMNTTFIEHVWNSTYRNQFGSLQDYVMERKRLIFIWPNDTVLLCKVNISWLDDGIRFPERAAVGLIQFRDQCVDSPSSEAGWSMMLIRTWTDRRSWVISTAGSYSTQPRFTIAASILQ
jgi:hypothetical protein